MQLVRPPIATDPRQFGRGLVRADGDVRPVRGLSDDLRLFLMTFAAGFMFVSVFIA